MRTSEVAVVSLMHSKKSHKINTLSTRRDIDLKQYFGKITLASPAKLVLNYAGETM
jgi:hypothetical protein